MKKQSHGTQQLITTVPTHTVTTALALRTTAL